MIPQNTRSDTHCPAKSSWLGTGPKEFITH
jgi:hypothetical protein